MSMCQLKLRQTMSKDFASTQELQSAKAYVLVVGVAGRGLAAFRVHELLDQCQSAQ